MANIVIKNFAIFWESVEDFYPYKHRQIIWIYTSIRMGSWRWVIFGGVEIKKINTRKQRCLWWSAHLI